VDAIAATIASEHPKAALRFLDNFDAAVDRLVQFPALAQVWPTNRPDTFATVSPVRPARLPRVHLLPTY
jgi:plasmid stabilization system protein ParE